ncbi:flavodoxin domain-containing protein, partial [Vibrio fortis]
AGALYYPRYNFFDRTMIRFIMTMTGGETDTSKEVEYTNWQKVSLFTEKLKNL